MKKAIKLTIFALVFLYFSNISIGSITKVKTGSDTIYINENQFQIKNIQAYREKMYLIPFPNSIVMLNAVADNKYCRCGQLRNNMLFRIYTINLKTNIIDSIDLDSSSRDFTRLRKLNDSLFYFSYYDSSTCKSIAKTHATRESQSPNDVDDTNLYLIEHFYIYNSQVKLIDSFTSHTDMNARVFNAKYQVPIDNIRQYGNIYNGIFDLPLEAENYEELKLKYKPLLKYIPAVIKEESFYEFNRCKLERTGWNPIHNADNIFFFPNEIFTSEYKRRAPKQFPEWGKALHSHQGKKMLYINDTLRKDFFKEHDSDITLVTLYNNATGSLLSVRLCGGITIKKPTYMELSLTSGLSMKKIKLPVLTEFFSITTFSNGNIEFLDRFSKDDAGIFIYNKNLELVQKITDENTFLTSYQPLGSFEIDGNPYNRKTYSREDFENEAKLLHVKRNENHIVHKYHFKFPDGFQALTAFYQDGYGVFVVKNYTTGMVNIFYDKAEKIFGK